MSQDNLPEKISPEGVRIANAYLKSANSIQDTALAVNLQPHEVAELLNEPHVKKYVNGVMSEAGFRHMDELQDIMKSIIETKMQELQDADIGSSKDIADLISLASKMAHDKAKLIEARNVDPKIINQKNTQFNAYGDSSNYGKLMLKLAQGEDL